MNKKISCFSTSLLIVSMALLVSCEWEGSNSDSSFNSAGFSWVNFSGVYRAVGGGVLVSAFTSGTTTPGTPSITNSVTGESVGIGDGGTLYSGVLNSAPIVPGSLTITAGGSAFIDDGSGGLSGGVATGSIDYGTGAWSIDMQGFPIDVGVQLRADYSFVVVGTGGSGDAGAIGSSGAAIFQFTMFHAGNKIELTDNTGAKYTGKFGKLQTTGGIDATSGGTTGPSPSVGDSAVGEFTAKGVSSAGVSVMIVGTFQGVVSGGAGGLFLSNRLMLGSWIEPGIQGNINGQAAPIGIATTN